MITTTTFAIKDAVEIALEKHCELCPNDEIYPGTACKATVNDIVESVIADLAKPTDTNQ